MPALLILLAGIVLGALILYFILRMNYPSATKVVLNYSEEDAQAILQRNGYKIIEKQRSSPIVIFIDGKSHLATAAADYLVEKSGRKYIVCVTQEEAADPAEPILRRKLVEAKNIFPKLPLLLLNIKKGSFSEIDFEFPPPQKEFSLVVIIALSVILVIAAVVMFLIQVKLF